uniref:Protein HGH1 homolog n=1 Tax=Timema tahoe TaxID=61484 RepID=A0A7R9FK67_9NEOP|nr:unnamed protein product [Timema tahoe]
MSLESTDQTPVFSDEDEQDLKSKADELSRSDLQTINALKEIAPLLNKVQQHELITPALAHILSLSGTVEGVATLLRVPEVLAALVILTQKKTGELSKDACSALVNVAASSDGADCLLATDIAAHCLQLSGEETDVLAVLLAATADPQFELRAVAGMAFNNLTAGRDGAERVARHLLGDRDALRRLVEAFTSDPGGVGAIFARVLANLAQVPDMRRYYMNHETRVLQNFLPFLSHGNAACRAGVAALVNNCVFDIDEHEWLLSPEVDLLSYVLLPLAGPEEFDEEDTNKLPPDLQYLPTDKQREPDPDIRMCLIETVNLTQTVGLVFGNLETQTVGLVFGNLETQTVGLVFGNCETQTVGPLCAKKSSREFIRSCNTYVIFRELYKWETTDRLRDAAEAVIDILIRYESEIGVNNLYDLEIPEDVKEKIEKLSVANQ